MLLFRKCIDKCVKINRLYNKRKGFSGAYLGKNFHSGRSRRHYEMAKCIEVNRPNVVEFINSFDVVLTDCDGVLWNGPEAIAGAQESFELLKSLGKRFFPVTNNSTKSREEYAEKCEQLGFHCEKEDIVGSSYVTSHYIKDVLKYSGKIFMLGSSGLYRELRQAGFDIVTLNQSLPKGDIQGIPNMTIQEMAKLQLDPEVNCVVVGFDQDVNYMKLAIAASYISKKGCFYVATNTDAGLPMGPGRLLPGTGAIVAAVTTAVGREPDVICGKPSRTMFDVVEQRLSIDKERTIMIGDRLNTDIALAHNCGIRALHVHTGVHHLEDAQRYMASHSAEDQKLVPHYYVRSFGELAKLYKEAKNLTS